jgi:hypothetical protein
MHQFQQSDVAYVPKKEFHQQVLVRNFSSDAGSKEDESFPKVNLENIPGVKTEGEKVLSYFLFSRKLSPLSLLIFHVVYYYVHLQSL